MTRQEEIAIFDRMKAGDKKALEFLFKAHYSTLCNFSLSIVKNKEIAEEAVGDIFFMLWNDRDKLNISQSVKAYLFKAVKNESIKLLNKERRLSGNWEELHPNQFIDKLSPETTLVYKELKSKYQAALEALPKQCKLIFKMHKIDDLKYEEISDILELSVKTVENQMSKALRLIRKSVLSYQIDKY